LTAWFVVSVVSGFVLVFFAHEFVQEVVLLGPSLIVAVYAVVVWRGVRNSVDAEFQEHHIDSVYFLGFLFTLISLFSLFASYAGIGRAGLVKPNIDDVFFYVGIAVTTSVVGVMLRSVVKGVVLKTKVGPTDELTASYELLRDIAAEFSTNYSSTFGLIQKTLEERATVSDAIKDKEQQYLLQIDKVIDASESLRRTFSEGKTMLSESIQGYTDLSSGFSRSIRELDDSVQSVSEHVETLNGRMSSIPAGQLAESFDQLSAVIQDFEKVLDGISDVFGHKLTKIK